ncbi:PAS domain S-box protein [Rhodopirellula europaea]|uniref:Protein containing Transcription regulator LuxR n=1 Tax=Rhodopirellula europaea SH398 TaxID=1263868 RepID=M5SAQ5_9BACT|nr:PAS domain S-box protein [Rhodopirellula europaea]EMI23239.1 protein containing Transcription regulator LuxR [Rhodopirellula europaea SH398]
MASNSKDSNRAKSDQRIDVAHQSIANLGSALDEFEIGFVRLETATMVVQDVNRTLAKMIGREESDLIEQPLSQWVVDAEQRSRFIGFVESLRESSTRCVVDEFPMTHGNNATIWLRYTFVANQVSDRQTDIVNATAIDVTHAKDTEEELRLANDRFDSAQANSRVGSWEWVEGEPMGWWSRQLYELHNMDPSLGPATFEQFIEMVNPDDREKIVEVNRPPFIEGDVRRFEFSSNPAFGPQRYFAATVWLTNVNGKMVRRGTTQDITQPVALRSALQKSEEQYREMVMTNAEGNAVLNLDGRLLQVDRTFASMLGQEVDSIAGLNLCQLAEAESAKLIEDRMLHRNKSEAHEVRLAHKDGHLVWLLLTCEPLVNDSNQFIGIQAHAVDITHRKHVETLTKLAAEAKEKLKRLTIRERQVLEQIVEGRMNKVIANRLEISEKTVERHRSNLMKKLDAQSVAELVKLSMTAEIMTAS